MIALLVVLTIFLVAPTQAQVENPIPVTVVSAASYQPAVAPESLAAAFGTSLASETIAATPDSSGRYPTELGGTVLEVNGLAAALIFVSPGQVNFVVPSGVAGGTADIVVRASRPGLTSRGSAEVVDVAPALFSRDNSGSGPGSILNAVTFARDPFLVETPELTGDDRRTRLAIFATGVRLATELTVQAWDGSGPVLTLPVEFTGPAPGFEASGLDQINAVLPAEFDGAEEVNVAVTTDSFASNPVTFEMNRLPSNLIRVAELELAATSLREGNSTTARVRLNGRAPAVGVRVALTASGFSVRVPSFVLISGDEVSERFTIETGVVTVAESVKLTASSAASRAEAELSVIPLSVPRLVGISLSPNPVAGGKQVEGEVRLNDPVRTLGVEVSLESDSRIIEPPESVAVRLGASTARFTAATSQVSDAERVTLSAELGGDTREATVEIRPPLALSITPEFVTGGDSATLRVILAEPASVGSSLVGLRSSVSAAIVPSVAVVPAGQTTATETVRTLRVSSARLATITASRSNQTAKVEFSVLPPQVFELDSVSLDQPIVRGGESVTGTISFLGRSPTGGVFVTLGSSNPMAARVTSPLFVAAGSTSAQFFIQTSRVTTTATVVIAVSFDGVTKTTTLIVN